jgi:hypothetical protein
LHVCFIRLAFSKASGMGLGVDLVVSFRGCSCRSELEADNICCRTRIRVLVEVCMRKGTEVCR